jgi:hypothetical protein
MGYAAAAAASLEQRAQCLQFAEDFVVRQFRVWLGSSQRGRAHRHADLLDSEDLALHRHVRALTPLLWLF